MAYSSIGDPRLRARVEAAAIVLTSVAAVVSLSALGSPQADTRLIHTSLAAGVWAILVGWGVSRPADRGLLRSWGALVLVILAAVAFSEFPLASGLYGGSAGGSGFLWIVLLGIFLAASGLSFGRSIRLGLVLSFLWVVPVAYVGLSQGIQGDVHTALANGNVFGMIILAWMPVSLGLARTSRTQTERALWYVIAALLVAAVIASGSVFAQVGLVFAGLLIVAMAPSLLGFVRAVPKALSVTAGVIAIAGTLLSFALLVPTVLQAALDVPVIAETIGATGTTRSYMWQAAGDIVAAHPILGTGPDSYRHESQEFLVAELHDIEHGATPLTALPPQPHSVFWDLAVSTGGLGLLAAALLLVAWARSVRSRTDASHEAADLRMGLAIGFLSGAFVSLFVPYNIVPAATLPLLAGLAAAGGGMRDLPPPERPMLRHLVSSAIALLLVMFAVTTFLGARSYRLALDAPVASDAAASLDNAVLYRPGESPYRFLRLWQIGSVSRSEQEIESFQEAVDSESALVNEYAPYVVEFVRISLDQAAATGREDLSWEQDALARMRDICPTLPELYAEELHVVLVRADADEIANVLDVVQEFAAPAPQFDRYMRTARAIVGDL